LLAQSTVSLFSAPRRRQSTSGCYRLGQKQLHKLDIKLVGSGTRYDIINVEPFTELASEGLPRALLQAIKG
jgi:hypothetical protein